MLPLLLSYPCQGLGLHLLQPPLVLLLLLPWLLVQWHLLMMLCRRALGLRCQAQLLLLLLLLQGAGWMLQRCSPGSAAAGL
jgi:hypothetical protein